MNAPRLKATGLRERVLSSVFWVAAMQYTGQIVSWAITLYVIRLLDPDDYGLMAKTTICIGFMLMVSELGLTVAVIQKKDIEEREIASAFGFVIVAGAAMAAALYWSAPFLADFFGDIRLVPIYRTACLVFLILPMYIIPQALMIRRMEFRAKSIVDVHAAVLGALFTLILAWYGAGVWALLSGLLASQAVSLIGFNLGGRDTFLKPSFHFSGLRKLFSFGGYISGTRLLWYVYSNADLFIGGRFLPSREMGIYAIAATLASLPLDKFTPVVTQVALPAFALIQDEAARLKNNFLKSIRLLSLVVFPISWGFMALAPDIMKLFGDKWSDAAVPIQILCLIIPFRAVGSLLAPALQGMGKPGVHFVNLVIMSLTLIAAFLIGVRWGILGLSIAWVAGYGLAFVVTAWLSLRAMAVDLREAVSAISIPLLSSTAMLACIYFLKTHIGQYSLVLLFSAVFLAGAGIYAATVFIFRESLIHELVFLFKRRA